MSNIWSLAKELKVTPQSLEELSRLPYTISYVLRKQMQVSSFSELPEEKQPPETIVWWGTPEELKNWINKVIYNFKESSRHLFISEDEVE